MKPRMPNSPPAVALDAARAHIAELEAAQPDQKSLFGFDLKNDKPDNIAEAIIGNVDLGRAEKIARAILKAVKAKSRKPGPDHAVDSDHHLTHQRPTARGKSYGIGELELVTLQALSTLAGGVLGRRFKVFVLFPAMLFVMTIGLGLATAEGSSFWGTLPALGLSFAGLQVGFVVSCLLLRSDDIVKVESPAQPQDSELEAARKQLDAMVPDLLTLSKQMTEQPAAANVRAEDPSPAGFARSKAS
jgi:hypothetical protein